MQTRTQLILLESLRRQRKQKNAFTLIELMIVVAIVGILAAVAIPKYLEARRAAAAGAMIGEKTGLAKECATFIVSGGVGSAPTYGTVITGTNTCALTGGSFVGTWSGAISGLKCLTIGSSATGTSVTVNVANDGGMTCTIT